eukprot:8745883-Pyramimonas_sp.AAC.1
MVPAFMVASIAHWQDEIRACYPFGTSLKDRWGREGVGFTNRRKENGAVRWRGWRGRTWRCSKSQI